ncbi:MAG: hypothetical protein H0T46_02830 [Deltaproteobacteria bacterium]|nr:hypothetical protein [Deltaproteobacteria bacterium]
MLPRRAVVELLESDAPRVDAMRIMRRACILEALQHPAVPRVFECGRLAGQPWVAIEHEQGTTLHDELQHRPLQVREALTLLEEIAAVLSHAHARGVLHGNVTPMAIVRAPTLRLQRWENARVHDTELSSEMIDGCDDVFSLGKTISAALTRSELAPEALTRLLARMLATDPAMRPTSSEVVTAARSIHDAIGPIDEVDMNHLLEALAGEADDDGPEIVIDVPTVESHDDEPILLDRPRATFQTVIVDLDACL